MRVVERWERRLTEKVKCYKTKSGKSRLDREGYN